MKVLVINKHGQPLMPTTPPKARILLQSSRAKIVGRDPFTIQLIYGSSGYKQPISLGIDAGYKHIGFSAHTRFLVERWSTLVGDGFVRSPKIHPTLPFGSGVGHMFGSS